VSFLSYITTAETLFHLIPLLDKKFIRPVAQHFKPQLTQIQFHVLTIARENKATMTELANEILLSKQQMTPIIDKLVTEGLVQREYDAIDRRIIRISITSAGLQLCEQAKVQTITVLRNKLECLSENDLISLDKVISEFSRIAHKLP
jgi:DNA-binding MarR family transcriptional regulator